MNDGAYCDLCGAATDRRVRCLDYTACLNRALSQAHETCDVVDAYKAAFIAMIDEVGMAERRGAERERKRIGGIVRAAALDHGVVYIETGDLEAKGAEEALTRIADAIL